MKRYLLMFMVFTISMFPLYSQEKTFIAIYVTHKNIPEDVNLQPAIDIFKKYLSQYSGYTVVERSERVLESRDQERLFQDLNASEETIAVIGEDHGAKYICNIDISYLPYEKTPQYYVSVSMVDNANTDNPGSAGYPSEKTSDILDVLSRQKIQKAALCLINDLDNVLHFITDQKKKESLVKIVTSDHNLTVNRKAMLYSFVPGLGLMKKGHPIEGTIYLVGEVACVGSIITSQNFRQNSFKKLSNTTDAKMKTKYANQVNTCTAVRNISIGTAALLYGLNLWRSYVAEPSMSAEPKWQWVFAPTPMDNEISDEIGLGIALTYRF